MDSKILQEAALSYLAVYDEELREELEECGVILSEDSGYYVDEAIEPGVNPYRPNPTQSEVRQDAAAARRRPLPRKQHESFDFYDLVLHHLISEGYADSVDSAEAIMANMSENWILSVIDEGVIVNRGISTNSTGEQIPWTHTTNTATGRSTVSDKFGERDATTRNPKDRSSTKIKDTGRSKRRFE